MNVKYICNNTKCSDVDEQAYELIIPSESIMDEKNIATIFCPHCNGKLECEGCHTAA